jgi:hypothetical protein
LTGAFSTNYTILVSTNVAEPITNILGTVRTDPVGVGTLTDTNALTTGPVKLYRAQSP